jgi:uncharacterized protein
MKRTTLFALFLVFLLPAALPSFAEKVSTTPAPTGYIDDYAQVFSADGKSDMEALCRELHDKTKAQVFVVTINTTEGEPVETFANELFAKWKIGEKKTDRGVLMLFAIKDRKRWIEIGYGLEGILNDAKVGDIGRTMIPALKAANYDEAAQTGLRQITQIIAADAGVTLDALSTPAQEEAAPAPVSGPAPSSESLSRFRWLFLVPFLIPILVFVFIFWSIFRAARRRALLGGGSDYTGGSSLGSSDSSSNSFGSSSDSGGDSFGGGDGGSSGGGGAGGDW